MEDLRHELRVILAANSKWFPKKWGTEAPLERDSKLGILADKIAEYLERVYVMVHRPPTVANAVSKYSGLEECPLGRANAVLERKTAIKRPDRFARRRGPSM
jgi:hypothetical protein